MEDGEIDTDDDDEISLHATCSVIDTTTECPTPKDKVSVGPTAGSGVTPASVVTTTSQRYFSGIFGTESTKHNSAAVVTDKLSSTHGCQGKERLTPSCQGQRGHSTKSYREQRGSRYSSDESGGDTLSDSEDGQLWRRKRVKFSNNGKTNLKDCFTTSSSLNSDQIGGRKAGAKTMVTKGNMRNAHNREERSNGHGDMSMDVATTTTRVAKKKKGKLSIWADVLLDQEQDGIVQALSNVVPVHEGEILKQDRASETYFIRASSKFEDQEDDDDEEEEEDGEMETPIDEQPQQEFVDLKKHDHSEPKSRLAGRLGVLPHHASRLRHGGKSSRDNSTSHKYQHHDGKQSPRMRQRVNEYSSPEAVVFYISTTLHEKKRHLICKIVAALGNKRALEVLSETLHMEESGGMMTRDGNRRRTAGGVYLQLIKALPSISTEQLTEIFEEDDEKFIKELKKRKRKIKDVKNNILETENCSQAGTDGNGGTVASTMDVDELLYPPPSYKMEDTFEIHCHDVLE